MQEYRFTRCKSMHSYDNDYHITVTITISNKIIKINSVVTFAYSADKIKITSKLLNTIKQCTCQHVGRDRHPEKSIR